jgi:hypothetical protein
MAQKNTTPPRLPAAPVEYDQQFIDQLTNVLRLYFAQISNPAPMIAASQNVGATNVVTAMSFAAPKPSNPAQFAISLPTQADVSNLRSGDVYYDTTGGIVNGGYPLRIKP